MNEMSREEALLHGSARGRIGPIPVGGYAILTESGRPSRGIRLSALTAISTSVVRRSSWRERKPSPITRLKRLNSASIRDRRLYPLRPLALVRDL